MVKRTLMAAAALLALPVAGAFAAPGDLHEINRPEVNLRAGPSDEAAVRSRLNRGEVVTELHRDGNWIAVQARSGAEGWVYGPLLKLERQSSLGLSGSTGPTDQLFRSYSQNFDTLIGGLSDRFGYRLFDRVEQAGPNTLRLIPTREFLDNAGREAHVLAALAVQQMWKNHQNGGPVEVIMMGDQGRQYVSLNDLLASGPKIELFPGRTAGR